MCSNKMMLALCLALVLVNQALSMPTEEKEESEVLSSHEEPIGEDQGEEYVEEEDRAGQRYMPHMPHYPNEYGQDPHYGAKNSQYGAKHEKKCETYYDYEYTEKCINYKDKVCYTKYKESCSDVTKNNCKGLIKSEQVRKCTNVTELLCGLAETVEYEMATASYTVQKCHKLKERVCDTVYEPEIKTKDDYHCINLKTYKCTNNEKTMLDKTCRYTTKHTCDSYDSDSYGSDSHGSGYSSGGNDAYNAYGASNSNGYGNDYEEYKEPKCTTKEEVKCYETPRTVPTLECKDEYEKVCEKFPENVPYAAEKQACHDEEKRVCELEERQQPKQIKKYVYKKMCKKIPREICSSADYKQLVPSCSPATFKNCRYEPKEECEEVPKNFCYKVPKKIKKQRCYNEYETQYGESKPAGLNYPAEPKPYHNHPTETSHYDQYSAETNHPDQYPAVHSSYDKYPPTPVY